MQNNVTFSIICPVYNAEKTLYFSSKSIIKQDYSNWELVLIDDGSKDSSGEICDQLVKSDDRIRVIHKANEGQAKARLDGVCLAQGKYLLFLDSDDQYEIDALTVLNQKLADSDVDFLVYNAKIISNKNNGSVYKFDSGEVESPMVECICKRRVSYFWSICVKKELFLNIEERVKDTFFNLRYSEDFYLIYNILKKVSKDRFSILDKKLYRYIANSDSITNTQNASKLMDRFFAFNYVYEDMNKNYPELFSKIVKEEKDSAGWTGLSAARKIALEYPENDFIKNIEIIRSSFLFNHFYSYKKDKYNSIAYILLKLKMYKFFRKYIIKHEKKKNEN